MPPQLPSTSSSRAEVLFGAFGPSPTRGMGRLAGVYCGLMALVTAAYASFSARVSQSWIMGEWLINYHGGFVRRGLVGEAIWRAARGAHRSPLVVALVLQLLLYTAFYAVAWRLARGVRWTLPLVALFISPATLAFIALDPPSSVRKEVLLFLCVGLLCLGLRARREREQAHGTVARAPGAQTTFAGAIALMLVAVCLVLAHEGLVFFLPYVFAPVFLARCGGVTLAGEGLGRSAASASRRVDRSGFAAASLLCLPAALAGIGVAFVSARHPGGEQTATAICRSLGGTMEGDGRGFCGGAIAYLAHDRSYAHADLLRAAHAYHYGVLYGVTGALALLPVAMSLSDLRRRGRGVELGLLLVSAASAGAGSVVLFLFARDWGRWISIHVTCLALLLLFVWGRDREQAGRTDAAGRAVAISSRRRAVAALLLLVYGTCWNLPAAGNYHPRLGYFGLARYFAGYRTAPHNASGQR